jgi:hypothetical protein
MRKQDAVAANFSVGQLLPDDRKIEWASTLPDAERLLVGAIAPPAITSNPTSGNDRLERARELFEEMQREDTAGNFARYGELLQQLGKLLRPQ